jgi:hypothetical protein
MLSNREFFGLIDLCQEVHGSINGTGRDALNEKQLRNANEWLLYRLDVWHDSGPEWEKYDTAVSNLVIATMREIEEELRRRSATTDSGQWECFKCGHVFSYTTAPKSHERCDNCNASFGENAEGSVFQVRDLLRAVVGMPEDTIVAASTVDGKVKANVFKFNSEPMQDSSPYREAFGRLLDSLARELQLNHWEKKTGVYALKKAHKWACEEQAKAIFATDKKPQAPASVLAAIGTLREAKKVISECFGENDPDGVVHRCSGSIELLHETFKT